MFNNLDPAFKTYFIVVNNHMQKDEKLEKNKVLFKFIEEKKTRIKVKYKISTNFASIMSNTISKRGASKRKKEFLKWPKYKKYGCKYLADQVCKYTNDECDKYYKKGYISQFHDS